MIKFKKILLLSILLLVVSPFSVFAAESYNGYVTINDNTTKYLSLDEAVNAVKDKYNELEITYNIYGSVKASGNSRKYTPNLALAYNASGNSIAENVKKVNIIGKTDDAKVTLTGVYYQKLTATGASLYVENVILDDARNSSSEGRDPDPWEFTYIKIEADKANFKNCTFNEGIFVDIDTKFENCFFELKPEYYDNLNDNIDYVTDHYSLWISNYGDVEVNNCEFKNNEYGAIKSTWNKYGTNSDLTLKVTNTTFANIGKVGEHKLVHLDGAVSIEFTGNKIYDSFIGDGVSKFVNEKTGNATIKEENNNFLTDASSIKLSSKNNLLSVGSNLEIVSEILPDSNGIDVYDKSLTWTSSNNKVATVKDGIVTAVDAGKVTITATTSNKKSTTLNFVVYKVENDYEENIATDKIPEKVEDAILVKDNNSEKTSQTINDTVNNVIDNIISSNNVSESNDKNKGVVSETTASKIKKVIESGKSVTSSIVVNKINTSEVEQSVQTKFNDSIKSELNEDAAISYFDISLVLKADNNILGNVHQLSEKVVLTIAVPEELKSNNRQYKVVRYHDSKITILDTTLNTDGTITFATDQFSTYAIAYIDVVDNTETDSNVENEDKIDYDDKLEIDNNTNSNDKLEDTDNADSDKDILPPKTSDGITTYVFIFMISLVSLIGSVLYLKRHNN